VLSADFRRVVRSAVSALLLLFFFLYFLLFVGVVGEGKGGHRAAGVVHLFGHALHLVREARVFGEVLLRNRFAARAHALDGWRRQAGRQGGHRMRMEVRVRWTDNEEVST